MLASGGIAIFPSDVGYGIASTSEAGNRRIVAAKGRDASKRQGMVMSARMETEIHCYLTEEQREIVQCITHDFDLPLGVVARYDPEHPMIKSSLPTFLELCTANGTIAAAVNGGGPFHERLGELSLEHELPITGSSANRTGRGTKYRVEDIEPELRDRDLICDYGRAATTPTGSPPRRSTSRR